MIKFGEKVKQLREEKGMTQQILAESLYVTRQTNGMLSCLIGNSSSKRNLEIK